MGNSDIYFSFTQFADFNLLIGFQSPIIVCSNDIVVKNQPLQKPWPLNKENSDRYFAIIFLLVLLFGETFSPKFKYNLVCNEHLMKTPQ